MKKLLTLSALLLVLFSQGQQEEKIQLKKIDEEVNRKKTGDDKSVIVPVLGAIAELASQDGQTILFQPTIYSLATLLNPKLKSDVYYRKMSFARNLQLNIGITPSENSILKYDGARLGFTFAILNNKTLKARDYEVLVNSLEFQNYRKVAGVWGNYSRKNINKDGTRNDGVLLGRLLHKHGLTKDDLAFMSSELKAELMAALQVTDANEVVNLYNAFEDKYEATVKELQKKTALTFDLNSVREFPSKNWGELTITPINLYHYFAKNKDKSPAMQLKVNYGFSRDTATGEPLKRRILTSELGFNFILIMNNVGEPVIEIKPGVKHSFVAARLYDKEEISKFDPTAIFRFRINKNFYLPIKVEYDTVEGEILGALAVQFSLQ